MTSTSPANLPSLACYASPYGIFGLFLHLELYYNMLCILLYARPSLLLRFSNRQERPHLANHRLNVFFCLLFSISGFLLTAAALMTCSAELELYGYWCVSAILPFTAGILMTGRCLRDEKGGE
jgi:hypothetical protein